MDSRLGDLVTPDMVGHFREILANPARDDARQSFVLIVVEMLGHGSTLPAFADLILGVVRDGAWWPRIRIRALDAFVRNLGGNEGTLAELKHLFSDVIAGVVPDTNDALLGCLLTALYPEMLSTHEVLQYLRTPKDASYFGMYESFWTRKLPEKSTNAQLAELLDTIVHRFNRLKPVFVGPPGKIALLRPVPFPVVAIRSGNFAREYSSGPPFQLVGSCIGSRT